jgi:hypothetical protein
MKLLISHSILNALIQPNEINKRYLEDLFQKTMQNNNRLYISIITIGHLSNQFSEHENRTLIDNLEVMCDEILPFTLEIYKLATNLKNNIKLDYINSIEQATAAIYGMDKIFISKEPYLISVLNFSSESH